MPVIPTFGVLLNSISVDLSECCLLWAVARQAPKRGGLFSVGAHWLVGQVAVQMRMGGGRIVTRAGDVVSSKPAAGRGVRR